MKFDYDIIVIGAGHAGCEAACAAANLGSQTLLITMDMNKIAQMSCNPAIGGIAKGQIVREIDALGGFTGIVTDKTSIQFRMLNRSKGPAMWSPRSQCDRAKFIETWRNIIEHTDNLYMWQDSAIGLEIENGAVVGVKTAMGVSFSCKSVVLTNGTFLNGLLHIGKVQMNGGRVSEPASYGITEQLVKIGFTQGRMKTGTPMRIDARTVDFSQTTIQNGEIDFHKFSYLDTPAHTLKQLPCFTVYTNLDVHGVLEKGLKDSPLYNGQIQSIGPRYCPSIETKIITFAEKSEHQLFLEPEGENTTEYYLNGFSSSLPIETQINALKEIPAFRNTHIFRPGYAIEYDFFDPTQLRHTLETKRVKNLFFAGQINGTTGYEEAAGQGLIAGINAHTNCVGGEPFILNRDEAYIGVLIDDLVTKGVDEPYRMFTSRAEYRILLRQDDADSRLTEKSYKLGLASQERYNIFKQKQQWCDEIRDFLNKHSVKPVEINSLLKSIDSSPLKQTVKLIDVLLRPKVSLQLLIDTLPALQQEVEKITNRREEVLEKIEISAKYEGYIIRERLIADKLQRLENIKIKGKFNYETMNSLSTEAKQKLKNIDPETIAQASRIPGVSPSDVNILLVLLGR